MKKKLGWIALLFVLRGLEGLIETAIEFVETQIKGDKPGEPEA